MLTKYFPSPVKWSILEVIFILQPNDMFSFLFRAVIKRTIFVLEFEEQNDRDSCDLNSSFFGQTGSNIVK
jgi:hypothetical protein